VQGATAPPGIVMATWSSYSSKSEVNSREAEFITVPCTEQI